MPASRLVATVVAFAATVAVACAFASPASAHASLASTNPEPDAVLPTLPTQLALTFTENVGTSFIALIAPDGSSVDVSKAQSSGHTASASVVVDPDIKGTYTVAYRVVSADSHPVDGTYTFTVTSGEPAGSSTVTTEVEEKSFVHRHRSHIVWGVLGGLIAIALMLAPLWRREADQ